MSHPLLTTTPVRTRARTSPRAGRLRTHGVARVTALLCSLIVAGCVSPARLPALAPNELPPVVAVTSFENRAGAAGTLALGSGMAELLTTALVESRRFVTVERGELGRIVEEIQLQRSGLFRAEGRVDSGELRGARYLVRGVVTDFTEIAGGSLWARLRANFVRGDAVVARVALTLSVIDVESGTILGSVPAAAEVSSVSTEGSVSAGELAIGGAAFARTPLGRATERAIDDAVHQLVEFIPVEVWSPRIAAVEGDRLLVNGGRDRGVRVGTRYSVRTRPRPVTDPLTGESIGELAGRTIGEIEITEVLDRASVARAIEGGGFDRGQWLEQPTRDDPSRGAPTRTVRGSD